MSIIARQDTNGTKPLLQTGELGYDNYPAGGDKGRVFVGTGTENIGLAKESADIVQIIFLGAKSVDPVVDNQGNPLVVGANGNLSRNIKLNNKRGKLGFSKNGYIWSFFAPQGKEEL